MLQVDSRLLQQRLGLMQSWKRVPDRMDCYCSLLGLRVRTELGTGDPLADKLVQTSWCVCVCGRMHRVTFLGVRVPGVTRAAARSKNEEKVQGHC